MNIVILDGISITPDEDLKWDRLEKMGSFRFYGNSTYEECFDRVRDADAIFFSKIHMDRTLIQACRNAKFFCVTATGTDNLDVDAAREQGIACTYVPGYASDARRPDRKSVV